MERATRGGCGMAVPTKSGRARGKTHLWDILFGVAQAAQKFGASCQKFNQSDNRFLLCFVVCEEYDALSQQPILLPVPCNSA